MTPLQLNDLLIRVNSPILDVKNFAYIKLKESLVQPEDIIKRYQLSIFIDNVSYIALMLIDVQKYQFYISSNINISINFDFIGIWGYAHSPDVEFKEISESDVLDILADDRLTLNKYIVSEINYNKIMYEINNKLDLN